MLGQAETARAEGMAQANEREAARQREVLEHQQRVEADTQQRMGEWQQRSAQIADDIRGQKIDPNRMFGNASAATKFSMVIGGALGGIVSAWSGGENQFLKTVNGLIERDLNAQQDDYNRQKDYLKSRDTLYGQMRETAGDQRLAALQYRQGMLEQAKTQLQADSDRLGIPEIAARNKILVDGVDREQAKLQKEIDAHALQVKQQQATAAAAATQAREKQLWDRSMELAKLDLEKRKIEGESGKKAADSLEKRTQGYGEKVGKPEFVEAANALAGLKAQLPADQNQGIPGLTPGAEFRDKWLGTTAFGSPTPTWLGGLSDQERVNRQDWNQFFDKYRVAVTGAGAGEKELAMLKQSFQGARTPAEQRNAIARADALLQRLEANASGTFGADAKAAFVKNMRASR